MFTAHAACGFICILPRPPPKSRGMGQKEGSYFGVPLLCPAFAQRARTACRAISCRRSGLSLAALAFPPIFPPLRPKATAWGFFRLMLYKIYLNAHEVKLIFLLTILERLCILDGRKGNP